MAAISESIMKLFRSKSLSHNGFKDDSTEGSFLGVQAWRGMVSDRARVPQHAPKIILAALLSRTLDIKIASLVLIFKLQH